MTEEGLTARLPITEWYDIEREKAIVARMTADRSYFETSTTTESPQCDNDEEEKY